ncbi:hypothetical protein DPMN_008494 [Dreissena polymorpha]|uniref:Uncharacterized protein n=1 Tax=Dreissena polymorpha TaxID=45954 RepID=A0A9D4MY69_DREPO|nr:hypothetical protein DPMN_008494 [Dreissena polymorpha]
MDMIVPDRTDKKPGISVGFWSVRSSNDHHPENNTESSRTKPTETHNHQGQSCLSYGPTQQRHGSTGHLHGPTRTYSITTRTNTAVGLAGIK